jgi:hypothetical protein
MTDTDDAITAAMEPFLSSRLSDIGLDYETYGPYLLPLFSEESVNDDDEWGYVLEVLLSSLDNTEISGSNDEQMTWSTSLRVDSVTLWRNLVKDRAAQNQTRQEKDQKAYSASLEVEREVVRQAELARQQAKAVAATTTSSSSTSINDAAKRALVERYAYDEDDEGGIGGNGGEEETVVTNQEAAAAAARERAEALKSKNVTSKKEEQQKTAKARLEKARLKEERRSRATKGERKR